MKFVRLDLRLQSTGMQFNFKNFKILDFVKMNDFFRGNVSSKYEI